MVRVVASRVLGMIAALFVLSVVAFSMVRLLPGNVSDALLGGEGSEAAKRAIIHRYGLDKPVIDQYFIWLGHALRGDFGQSADQRPVLDVIKDRVEPSLSLCLLGILLSVAISILLGTIAGVRQKSIVDRGVVALAVISSSVPDFVIGLILILVVAKNFHYFPTFGYSAFGDGLGPWLQHLILPAIALSALLTGLLTRLTRTAVAETLSQEFVRTARGKGLSSARVYSMHVLRPSLIPVVTTAALYFVAAIPSVVVIETVFSIPGIGSLIVNAISVRDYATLQGATLLIGGLAIFVSFAVDLSYRVLDPRTRRR